MAKTAKKPSRLPVHLGELGDILKDTLTETQPVNTPSVAAEIRAGVDLRLWLKITALPQTTREQLFKRKPTVRRWFESHPRPAELAAVFSAA